MAQKRDVIDDLIDIQSDWKAVKNPLGGLAGSLAVDPDNENFYDPSDYKERPRANSLFCTRVASEGADDCHRCLDVCPVDAVTITKNAVKIADNCRKCGLCSVVCPTEVFVAYKVTPKSLYDRISKVASEYEQCYITCTRALGRNPKDNEILLPCVGAVSQQPEHLPAPGHLRQVPQRHGRGDVCERDRGGGGAEPRGHGSRGGREGPHPRADARL